ncbi:hypothetical protein [Legionella israelensis]|uniref:hypothetical protein n=1 Tax=Legionella israelensis TaxID=454 RepID=UPI00163DCCE8|nr:hypothetical protein [Legionella israelensis]
MKLGSNAGVACDNIHFTKYSQSYPHILWIRKDGHYKSNMMQSLGGSDVLEMAWGNL